MRDPPKTVSLSWGTEAAVEGALREAEVLGVAVPLMWTRSSVAQIQFTSLKTKRLGQMVTMGTFNSNAIGSRIYRVIKVCRSLKTVWPLPV